MVWWLRYFHSTKDKKEREMRGKKNTWGRQRKILSCKRSGLRWIQLSWWHHPEFSLLWSHSAKHKTPCFALWREQASWALALTGGAKIVKKEGNVSDPEILNTGIRLEHWTLNASLLNALCTWSPFRIVVIFQNQTYGAKPKHRDQKKDVVFHS